MKTKSVLAALAAAAPLALFGEAQGPVPMGTDTTTAAPAKVAPKRPYVPHKTPLARKVAPKKPAPPTPPQKPTHVPLVIYDGQGHPIPTSPQAYDVSSAKKK